MRWLLRYAVSFIVLVLAAGFTYSEFRTVFFGISSGQIVLFGLSEFLRDYFLKTIFLGHEGSEIKNGSVALIFRLHPTTQTQNRS
jgi:hypothetical protein